jgi:cyanophycin synthetase
VDKAYWVGSGKNSQALKKQLAFLRNEAGPILIEGETGSGKEVATRILNQVALVDALEQFPHERRTIVYSAAGDRRDCDMIRQGQLLGEAFDRVILYEDHYLRGRPEGEIMRLFRQGLAGTPRVADVQEFKGNLRAIASALRHARPGDLLVVQADKIDETMEFLHKYLAASGAGHEIELSDIEMPSSDAAIYYASQVVD